MASFIISLSGSAVVNGTKSWTISDSDVQSLANFLISRYSASGATPLTAQQALSVWAQDFVNRSISDVRAYQQSIASVTPIVFT